MDFKAEPIGFRAADGKQYDTEAEARTASMNWEMMAVLMRYYRYDRQDVALEHAMQIFELEDKGILTVNWDKIEEQRRVAH